MSRYIVCTEAGWLYWCDDVRKALAHAGEHGGTVYEKLGASAVRRGDEAEALLQACKALLPFAERDVKRLNEQMLGGLYPAINEAMLDRARAAIADYEARRGAGGGAADG